MAKQYPSNHPLRLMAALVLAVALACACSGEQRGRHYTPSEQEAMRQQIGQLLAQGKEARNNSRFDDAIRLHTEGLRLATELRDTQQIVQALNNMGTNYRRLGILEEASSYHYKALSYAMQHLADTSYAARKNYVTALNGIGNIYMTLRNYDQADSIFRRALAGERALGSQLGQAINLANLGSIMEGRGQIDSAWNYYRYAMAMNRQARSELGIALCYSHFGDLYEKSGDDDQALRNYQNAYDALHDSHDDWHRLDAALNMSRLHIRKGNLAEARRLLDAAEATARNIRSIEHQREIETLYYQYYEARGDARAALDHYIAGTRLEDSLLNMRKVNEIQNMRVELERERRQAEIDLAQRNLQLEHAARNTTIVAFSVLLLMAVLCILLLWRLSRRRSRAQHAKGQWAIGPSQWQHGDVAGFVQTLTDSYRELADLKTITLSYTHPQQELPMDYAPDYLAAALNALLANAIRQTPPFGRVNVTLSSDGQHARLQVFHTGTGISAATLPHVFDSPFRGSGDPVPADAPLGLSLVRLMVEAMHGTVEAGSILGEGTTFTIALPLTHE